MLKNEAWKVNILELLRNQVSSCGQPTTFN